jgi:hypothetical protein
MRASFGRRSAEIQAARLSRPVRRVKRGACLAPQNVMSTLEIVELAIATKLVCIEINTIISRPLRKNTHICGIQVPPVRIGLLFNCNIQLVNYETSVI